MRNTLVKFEISSQRYFFGNCSRFDFQFQNRRHSVKLFTTTCIETFQLWASWKELILKLSRNLKLNIDKHINMYIKIASFLACSHSHDYDSVNKINLIKLCSIKKIQKSLEWDVEAKKSSQLLRRYVSWKIGNTAKLVSVHSQFRTSNIPWKRKNHSLITAEKTFTTKKFLGWNNFAIMQEKKFTYGEKGFWQMKWINKYSFLSEYSENQYSHTNISLHGSSTLCSWANSGVRVETLLEGIGQ